MSDVVELSSGHVFAKGSVRCITPFEGDAYDVEAWFKIVGVGFEVLIHEDYINDSLAEQAQRYKKLAALREEAVRKLL